MSLAIISMLDSENRINVTEIYKKLNVEQAIASYHLTRLKKRGILSSTKTGKQIFYFLKRDSLNKIIESINKYTT